METGGILGQHFSKDTIKQNFTSIGMMRGRLYVHTLLQATISRDSLVPVVAYLVFDNRTSRTARRPGDTFAP